MHLPRKTKPTDTYPRLDEMLCGQRQRKVGKEQGERIQIRVQGEFIIVQQDAYIRHAFGLNQRLQANQTVVRKKGGLSGTSQMVFVGAVLLPRRQAGVIEMALHPGRLIGNNAQRMQHKDDHHAAQQQSKATKKKTIRRAKQ